MTQVRRVVQVALNSTYALLDAFENGLEAS
jgi:hypothetical protein